MEEPCEICGNTTWEPVNKNWKRCAVCGRLETPFEERLCSRCGKPVGRYAWRKQKICIDCEGASIPFEATIPCKTPACGNVLGKRASPTGYCKQCLREIELWNTPDGHLWKGYAISLLKKPKGRKALLDKLASMYPEITNNTLFNWLLRQTKAGILERVSNGVYRALTDGTPRDPGESPTSVQLDPSNQAGPVSIRIVHVKK